MNIAIYSKLGIKYYRVFNQIARQFDLTLERLSIQADVAFFLKAYKIKQEKRPPNRTGEVLIDK